MDLPQSLAHIWDGVPYPSTRLAYTLIFMVGVVCGAVWLIRRTARTRLISELASTLGSFMLLIGAIVYTAAFRGLRFWEMVVSWSLSAVAIYWFLRRMHVITRVQSAEQSVAAVEETEQRFQAIIEHASDVLSILELDGTRRYVSPALPRVLGFDATEMIGVSAFDILHPDDVVPGREMFAEVTAHFGNERSRELRFRHKDGGVRTLLVTGRNLADIPAVRGIVVNMRDVTAEKALQLELQQAQRMETVGQLAGGIAHDFNNLLTAINGRTEFLAGATNLDADQLQDVEEIRRAAERAGSLTRQLLAFSRKQLLVPRVLDLNQVIDGVEPMLRRLIGEDVQVHVRRAASLWNITADSGQIEQVLLNLAVNARDAMPGGGMLEIETANIVPGESMPGSSGASLAPCVMLRVADTGEGMDEHTRSHLFEPFFTTKAQGKGTGLGLSTVYGVVKQSGATITVDSVPGEGTSFRICFPCTGSRATPARGSAPVQASRGGTETVLLVEDDDAVRELARRMLRSRGYRVIEASGGGAALHAFEEAGGVDMVLTDLVMPGIGGRELIEMLQVRRPGLRVLYMSGYTDDEIVRRNLVDPRVRFLQKPFTAETLAAGVRSVLDGEDATAAARVSDGVRPPRRDVVVA